jgi:phospholipase C
MSSPKFDHLVVVMMENRSFDHMLGMLYTKDNPPPRRQTFHGLDGKKHSNPNPSNGSRIYAAPTTHWDGVQQDPNHDFVSVQWQLFLAKGKKIIPGQLPPIPSRPVASMKGFTADYAHYGYPLGEIMSYFPTWTAARPSAPGAEPVGLSVLPTLARAFAVSDKWFASVPTQTLPNRSFCNAGTSNGFVENSDDWTNTHSPTIFTALSKSSEVRESGIWPWRIYHDHADVEQARSLTVYIHWPDLKQYRPLKPNYLRSVNRFVKDARKGDLPAYSFIEPRINGYYKNNPKHSHHPNDQHPNPTLLDIRVGENFINRIYSAIANSPKVRDKTLLVITYDEHGGIFDHVSPPYGVPAPAPPPSRLLPILPVTDPPFDFTRLGVRVPAVIVSPYIRAGTVYHPPKSWVDHTAIIKTLTSRWNLKSLGLRDAAAPDLSELLTLRLPRTDFPNISPWIVPLPQVSAEEVPTNDLQRDFVQLIARAHGLPPPPPPATAADVMAFLRSVPMEDSAS